jgi:L-fuconolactonase
MAMKIDSHQHFWRYDAARYAWITDQMRVLKRDFLPQGLAVEMKASGVDASIAVQADQSESETLFLLDLAAGDDRIAGVVGWVDLCSPQVEERLQFFSRFAKLRGFRHIAQTEPDDRFLVRPEFTRGVSRLNEFGFTYDILIYPRQLPAAIQLVAKFPKQKFVLDHLAKPEINTKREGSWAAGMHELAANPNVYCKLSGLVTEADWNRWKPADFAPYLDVVFLAFGTDRLMFGSDWPVCLLSASYAQVNELIEDYVEAHAREEKEKIFGGNAMRFYGLGEFARGSAAQG